MRGIISKQRNPKLRGGINTPKGQGTTGTGIIVRDFLGSVKSAPLYDVWSHLRKVCHENGWHYPAYDHFTKYFSKLKRLGLVEFDHSEPLEHYEGHDPPGHPNLFQKRGSDKIMQRSFYKLNISKANSSDWSNPQEALYGSYKK